MSKKESFELINGEDLDLSEDLKKPDDLASTILGIFSISNVKLVAFLFIIFLFVSSDIFIEKFLSRFNNTTIGREPTVKGTIVQGIVLVLLFIFVDIILKMGLL